MKNNKTNGVIDRFTIIDTADDDDYYVSFSPGWYGTQLEDYSVYDHEHLSFFVHLMMQLVAHDEFDMFNNLDITKWKVEDNPFTDTNNKDYLSQLIADLPTSSISIPAIFNILLHVILS